MKWALLVRWQPVACSWIVDKFWRRHRQETFSPDPKIPGCRIFSPRFCKQIGDNHSYRKTRTSSLGKSKKQVFIKLSMCVQLKNTRQSKIGRVFFHYTHVVRHASCAIAPNLIQIKRIEILLHMFLTHTYFQHRHSKQHASYNPSQEQG